MILSTVPRMVVLGRSGIRSVSRFSSAILADLAKQHIYNHEIDMEAMQSHFAQLRNMFTDTSSSSLLKNLAFQAFGSDF